MKICNKCGIEKDEREFRKNKYGKDGLRTNCKDCEKLSYKEYYKRNKEKLNKKNKTYRETNKVKIAKRKKEYYLINKFSILEKDKIKHAKNKNKYAEQRKCAAEYEMFKNKLTKDESPRMAKDCITLEVKCKYCGKYFIPTTGAVKNRINSLNTLTGDRYLYCSDSCKKACPVYYQMKYPKGFKKASSREVDPLVRQLTFERDNWECQKCGTTQLEAQLHAHHIKPYTQNKILGNDVDNCITLCKHCHKKVHTQDGCRYHELKCQ